MFDYTNTTAQLTEHNLDTVVIPVGATEQFGPYLPMNLDTLIAEKYAKAYGEVLNAYVLPALPFNTSEEHANFKGTVTVSPNILTAMLEEIIYNLSKQGFCKFLICSGHGGAYWEGAFIKHINYKYPDILVIHPHHQHDAWSVAVKAAGFEGIEELHGGFMSVCTALWLCPENVILQSMGSEIPDRNRIFADFMGWDKLTKDGCWGNYVPGELTKEEMAEKGRVFWETFISRKCKGLKEVLEEAYQRKTDRKS